MPIPLAWLTKKQTAKLDEIISSELSFAMHFSKEFDPEMHQKKRNNVLLPIILENINSTAVMKLCIDNSMKVTAHLNGDQDTVITCDQPVYILVPILHANFKFWLVAIELESLMFA